jgi:D-xylono/L-arabinono-1,4-lactonase
MVQTSAPELIADYACHTGENPLWHPTECRLYWCDIPTGRLFRYDPAIGQHEQIYAGRPVGGFTFQADGGLLLFMDRGTIASWRDGMLTDWLAEIPTERESRFNDVIADPKGRVFCGTMSTEQSKGRLYRLDLDGSLHLVLEGIGCSNGMAFTQDRKGFYYTDSFAREIYRFDYDEADGSILNQRIFARFTEGEGLPDGATLDSEGHLWSALWDGGCIVRLSAEGGIAERIVLPVPKTSSLTFGGEDLSELYITTAGGNEKELDGPLAGSLFRLASKYKGLPEFFSRIAGP